MSTVGGMPADTLQAIVSVAGLILALIGLPVLFLQPGDVQRSLRASVHAARSSPSPRARGSR